MNRQTDKRRNIGTFNTERRAATSRKQPREETKQTASDAPTTESNFSPAVGRRLCLFVTHAADGYFLCLTRRSEGADSPA